MGKMGRGGIEEAKAVETHVLFALDNNSEAAQKKKSSGSNLQLEKC